MKELKKRIVTSIFLVALLLLMYLYSYILIISLFIISIIVWIEFLGLISKIFKKNDFKNRILKFFFKSLSLIYLFFLSSLIVYVFLTDNQYRTFIILSFFVAIASDIGGMLFGKFFKGKKLTKISPKKTVSGCIGSFIFSMLLIIPFYQNFENYHFIGISFFIIFISLISQIGDLSISFLKRKANVKDTSDILPGHGGFLDRIDGIIFTVPVGFLLSKLMFLS